MSSVQKPKETISNVQHHGTNHFYPANTRPSLVHHPHDYALCNHLGGRCSEMLDKVEDCEKMGLGRYNDPFLRSKRPFSPFSAGKHSYRRKVNVHNHDRTRLGDNCAHLEAGCSSIQQSPCAGQCKPMSRVTAVQQRLTSSDFHRLRGLLHAHHHLPQNIAHDILPAHSSQQAATAHSLRRPDRDRRIRRVPSGMDYIPMRRPQERRDNPHKKFVRQVPSSRRINWSQLRTLFDQLDRRSCGDCHLDRHRMEDTLNLSREANHLLPFWPGGIVSSHPKPALQTYNCPSAKSYFS